jgi:hypothetical protein
VQELTCAAPILGVRPDGWWLHVGELRVPHPLDWWSPIHRPLPNLQQTLVVVPGYAQAESLRGAVDGRAEVIVATEASIDEHRRADVVIDLDRSVASLAGLARGSVVVGGDHGKPFVPARAQDVPEVLRLLVTDQTALGSHGIQSREWLTRAWCFTEQWERYWMPLVASTTRMGALAR